MAIELVYRGSSGSGAVNSVNGKVGNVILTAEDVGALPKDTVIPSIEGLASETYVDNAVNGIDIPEVPKNISAFNNDSGYQTAAEVNTTVSSAIGKIEIPSIEGLATEDYVDKAISNIEVSGGSGIDVTGAKVGQTIKIAEVNSSGVPTAWEAVNFPSGGSSGGDNAFKFLASSEPITEPVTRIDVSIEEDGITEILIFGVVKLENAENAGPACIYINGQIASANAPVSDSYESKIHYQGKLIGNNRCSYSYRISQWGNGALTAALQDWENEYGEQVKSVGLQHSYWKNFAVGTSFEVWGR